MRPPSTKWAWAITLLAIGGVASMLPAFFRVIDGKSGIVPPEPLHPLLGPVDLGTPLFMLLYACIGMALYALSRRPALLMRGLQAYCILILLRMVAMIVVTLEPPADIIDLEDPVTQLFYPGHQPFRKDLFFSGHTATMVLLAFAVPWRTGRYLLGVAGVLIGAAVVVQHVHWTVDVLAAPFFAWAAWRGSALTMRCTAPSLPNEADA